MTYSRISNVERKDGLYRGELRSPVNIAVGQTPKTEYLWFESELRDAGTGDLTARKRMMCRWMKQSSPLYREP